MSSALTEYDPTLPDLAGVSDDDLLAELARGLAHTADTLYRLGCIWAELERRGRDLSTLRHGLNKTLPLIAAGRLAAEAVVSFAGRPALLRALEGVPLDRQRSLAAGEPVAVLDWTDKTSVQQIPLASLPSAAIRLVFGDGEVRSPDQQRMAMRPRKRKNRDDSERHYTPHYDRKAGTITIGRMIVTLDSLLRELSAAAGPDNSLIDAKAHEYVTTKVRLTDAESKRLVAAATRSGLPDWELIRKAMRAFGLI